jgi:hypothetical protein
LSILRSQVSSAPWTKVDFKPAIRVAQRFCFGAKLLQDLLSVGRRDLTDELDPVRQAQFWP